MKQTNYFSIVRATLLALLALLLVPKQASAETITYNFSLSVYNGNTTTTASETTVKINNVPCTYYSVLGNVENPERFGAQDTGKLLLTNDNGKMGLYLKDLGTNQYRIFFIDNLKAGDIVTFNASVTFSLNAGSASATASGNTFTMNANGILAVSVPGRSWIYDVTVNHPDPVVLNQYNYDYSIETYDLTNKTWNISAGANAGFNYPNGGGSANFISNPINYELNNRIIVMGGQIDSYTYNNGLYNSGKGTRIVSINDLHIGDRVKITYTGNAYFRTSHTNASNFAAANKVFLDTQNDGEKNIEEDVLIQAGDKVKSDAIYTMLFDGRLDIGLEKYASIQKIEIISDRTCNFVTDENNEYKLVFDGTGQLTSKTSYVAGLNIEFSNPQKSNEAVHVTHSDHGYMSVCEDHDGFKMARRSDLERNLLKAPDNGTFYKFMPEVDGTLYIDFKAKSVQYPNITSYNPVPENITGDNCPYVFVEAEANGNVISVMKNIGKYNGAWVEHYANQIHLQAGHYYYFYGWWANQNTPVESTSCGVAQLVSVEFDPDFEVKPLAKCVVNGTTEDSELATVTATNPTVREKRKSNNILSCTPTISNGKLQISDITFAEGSDQAGVILLEVSDGANTPQVFALTIAYSASYNNGQGHKWDFSDKELEIGHYFQNWFANVGTDGRAYTSNFHQAGSSGNLNGNDYYDQSVLNVNGSTLYAEMTEEHPDWHLDYARKVIDAQNNNFTTYYDPMFVNGYDMVGDNADMIWETEGLWFQTAPNLSCLFNEYLSDKAQNQIDRIASSDTPDPDRYVGIRKGGEFRIPKLYKDDRVIIHMGSAKGSGAEDEEFGGKRTLLFEIENARDAVYQKIEEDYWVGGSIWNCYKAQTANEHDHTDPNYRGSYHFFATGDPSNDTKPADMIFKLKEGSLCKIYSIEIYHDGTHHYTNSIQHANSVYDFMNDNRSGNLTEGANGVSNGGLTIHYRGKGEKIAGNIENPTILNEVLSYSGKISNLTVPTTGTGTVSYTSKVGDFGVILMRMKVMDYNQKYVTDFADRDLTVGYLEKIEYPCTWDFADMKEYSNNDIKAENDNYPKTTYANGNAIPAWEDQKIFNLSLWEKGDVTYNGTVVYQNVYKMNVYVPNCNQDGAEQNSHYIFSNNKGGGGNELYANDKIIPETRGLMFYTDNNDKNYNGQIWIDTDGLHLCNNTHQDWWNCKMVIPSVPAGAAVYLRMARDKKALPDGALDFQNDPFLYNRFQFGHMNTKANMGTERTDICKFYEAEDESGDYIVAIYNDGVASDLTFTLNGYVLKKLAVSQDEKTITGPGFASESRNRAIDHSLTGYMVGKDIKAYVVTEASASTNSTDGSLTVQQVTGILPAGQGCFLVNQPDADYNENADNSVQILNNKTNLFVADMHDQENISTFTNNLMKAMVNGGTIGQESDGNINYVLASSHQSASNPNNVTQKDKVAFYRAAKNGGASVPANGAYLAVPKAVSNSVKAFYMIYDYPEEPLSEDYGDQDVTSISLQEAADVNAVWYNMNGQKLNGRPNASGIYVVNGKKIVIK